MRMGHGMHKKIGSVSEINVFTKTGHVVGNTTWSETHVHGGGGSTSYSGGYHHHTTSPVSSTVTERNRFFLKQESGKELEIDNLGGAFAVREGHLVSAVLCGHRDEEWGYYVGFLNHDTEKRLIQRSALKNIRGENRAGCFGFLLFIGASFIVTVLFLTIFYSYARTLPNPIGAVAVIGGFFGLIISAIFVARRNQKFSTLDSNIIGQVNAA